MPLPRSPLAGLPNQKQVWSWISFDVANQSFTLIINTLLFSIFFQQVIVRDPARDDQIWSIVFASSMLLVVVASPIAGAIADGRGWRKVGLISTGVACGVLTCALALLPAGSLWLAALLYIPANFAFNIGENFLASFLPQLARREDLGRVSGFSWAVAYAAALLMLLAVAGTMMALSLTDSAQWRPFFFAAGLWFLAFLTPTLLFLREQKPAHPEPGNPIAIGVKRLLESARRTAQFRDLATLLLASFFYGGGMAVIVAFASIIAQDFGFSATQLVVFVAVITVSGIVGTLIPTFLQDRLGHKRTTVMLLAVMVLTAFYLAYVAHAHARAVAAGAPSPAWPVWLAGNLIGLGLGSLGTANRAFVGFLTPPARSAEFFGLWGLVFKLAAILTIPFGVVKDRVGMPAALLVLAAMFAVGLVATLFVNEHRGVQAADRG
jgi:UMF1 family MFS transporter